MAEHDHTEEDAVVGTSLMHGVIVLAEILIMIERKGRTPGDHEAVMTEASAGFFKVLLERRGNLLEMFDDVMDSLVIVLLALEKQKQEMHPDWDVIERVNRFAEESLTQLKKDYQQASGSRWN